MKFLLNDDNLSPVIGTDSDKFLLWVYVNDQVAEDMASFFNAINKQTFKPVDLKERLVELNMNVDAHADVDVLLVFDLMRTEEEAVEFSEDGMPVPLAQPLPRTDLDRLLAGCTLEQLDAYKAFKSSLS